ncbi:MAG: hypothetical protein WDM86_18205 [Rhizomicrobium sp.]
MPVPSENVCVVDGEFDVAALAGKAVYWFDLGLVLHRRGQVGPARLRLMCEQHVMRLVPDELVLFQPAGFYLVVRSCAAASALPVAQTVNGALLKLFFGTEAAEKIAPLFRVAQIAEIGGRENAGTATSPAPAAERVPDSAAPSETDPLADLAVGSHAGCDGLRLGFLPVYDLRRGTASTFLCTPTRGAPAEPATLDGIDPRVRPSLDVAMLERCLLLTREIAARRLTAAAVAPVSFETLASPRGRRLYQSALRRAGAVENPFLVVKIEDVPPGTPAARLAEIVAMVRAHARRVFAQLPSAQARLIEGGRLGATGLFAKFPDESGPAAIAALAKSLIRSAEAQHAFAYAENVHDALALGLVRRAGVRLASGRALGGGQVHAAAPDVLLSLEKAGARAA